MSRIAADRQRGAALIALVAVLVIAITAGILSLVNGALSQGSANRNRNAAVLQEAKLALIGYVVKEALNLANSSPGMLPCPESPSVAGDPGEGVTSGDCAPGHATDKTIGRLPWRTLGIDKLVDSASEPLWYAVSPNWVRDGANPVINAGTGGQLAVDGIGDVVAVIIAPGAPLILNPNTVQAAAGCAPRTQARNDHSHVATATAYPDYRDYLECRNATFPPASSFGSAIADNATAPVLNDQVVYITAKELLNAIQGPVAERVQRTVAPLLSEHADKWITASGSKFLPYAVSFAPVSFAPETSTVECGTAGAREGALPTAVMATPGCASVWQNFSITGTGNSVFNQGCTGSPVTCTFRYYTLNALGGVLDFLLNLLGLSGLVGNVGNAGAITATISADAPNAAVSFRDPLASGDIVVSGGLSHSLSLTPKVSGEANLRIQVAISSGANDLCTSVVGLVCNLLPGALTTPHTVTVRFPQLADATVQGAQLSSAVFPAPHTLSLLTPLAGEPHYWFFVNEWFRYTYYAVAPATSAAQSGGYLTVSGLPAANGSFDDKHFVLAVMGPAVTGQNSRPSNSVLEYLEGQNQTTGDNTFAHQVFSVSGNDRIAMCPYSAGSSVCN